VLKNIVIGTANFNQNYGLNSSRVNIKNVKKIINYSKKNKIKYYDTSASYKNTEKILGKNLNKNFNVITKLPPINLSMNNNKLRNWIISNINKSRKNLDVKIIYALLMHRPKSLLTKRGNLIFKTLSDLKKKGVIRKIGVSEYDFNNVKKIIKKYKIDIVQVPFNVFDQRLIYENFSKYKKLEIHCRSIFLQGLLLKESKNLPKKFNSLKTKWKNWDNWINIKKISKMEACLNFISRYKNVYDKVVVGIESEDQLKKIYNFKKSSKILDFSSFDSKKKQIIKKNFLSR